MKKRTVHKKPPASVDAGGKEFYLGASVDQLQRELPLAAIISILDLPEVACPKVRADPAGISIAFELRVVESIESLGSELHMELLGESEILQ